MLKKFTITTLVFIIPILGAYAILGYIVYESRNTYHIKKEILDNKHQDAEILILGNSHALFGVNPKYFKRNTINLSNANQSFYYDLVIAKENIEQMTHLKAIAINLSFFSFQYQLDDSPENWRRNYYYYYWGVKPFVPDADYYKEMFNLPLRMLKKGIQTSDLIDSLGYQNATGSANFNQDIDGLVARVDIYAEMYNKGTSEKNMILLAEIHELAQKRGIDIFFFITPKHKLYLEYFDKQIISDFEEQLINYQQINRTVIFDERSNPEFSNQCFKDFDHLNTIGAKKFSILLSEHIEKALLLNQSSSILNN